MKKNLMHFVAILGLVAGNVDAAQAPSSAQKRSILERFAAKKDVLQKRASVGTKKLVSRLKSEQDLMKRGLAAAKKRHIQKQALSDQEKRAYDATLKRVFGGSVAALLAAIGVVVAARPATGSPKYKIGDRFTIPTQRPQYMDRPGARDTYRISTKPEYDSQTGKYKVVIQMLSHGIQGADPMPSDVDYRIDHREDYK